MRARLYGHVSQSQSTGELHLALPRRCAAGAHFLPDAIGPAAPCVCSRGRTAGSISRSLLLGEGDHPGARSCQAGVRRQNAHVFISSGLEGDVARRRRCGVAAGIEGPEEHCIRGRASWIKGNESFGLLIAGTRFRPMPSVLIGRRDCQVGCVDDYRARPARRHKQGCTHRRHQASLRLHRALLDVRSPHRHFTASSLGSAERITQRQPEAVV
jgi:hypothetical protein